MTRLCLVRHGQTNWNLEGRYQGQSDVPLNENGRAQARNLAEQLQGQPFLAIYTSSLLRAKETADIIAAAVHLPVTFEPRLAEINQGEWEGQLVDGIKTRYAELWQQHTIDPASVRPPGGETITEVAGRVYAALNDITHLHPIGLVLVVSHGLALATVMCKVRGLPIEQAYTVIPDNAKPVWVDWEE
jgi:broad specificity phosphatase PhoE